ncbi:hypothetical protein EIKCOROL_02262 [Eikenella corrodens ATCC 23834]|uniref:Uncharacterized protein n=1 Tax=Eikenella corrodens ATCC 23834 TaxID=546274 RepID=C0DY00_EIKCO|nr:hypothetical protein EIKCOROL_02262 [Eikenella corrodens ATCC 23834]
MQNHTFCEGGYIGEVEAVKRVSKRAAEQFVALFSQLIQDVQIKGSIRN